MSLLLSMPGLHDCENDLVYLFALLQCLGKLCLVKHIELSTLQLGLAAQLLVALLKRTFPRLSPDVASVVMMESLTVMLY